MHKKIDIVFNYLWVSSQLRYFEVFKAEKSKLLASLLNSFMSFHRFFASVHLRVIPCFVGHNLNTPHILFFYAKFENSNAPV